MLYKKPSTSIKAYRDDQFSDQHSLKTFDQKLFGVHTQTPRPNSHNGVCDWVAEFTNNEIPSDATVTINQNNYLIGSIRFPAGTFGNYYDWDSEYISGLNGVYKEIFQKDNIYANVNSSISSYGQPYKFPIANFVDYAKNYVPSAQIHIMLNVYTQSIAEIKAAVDKFKTVLADNSRVIFWEMGNEMGGSLSYENFVNDAAEPGSFPNLTGDDLTKAYEYYPGGVYNPDVQAQKNAEICSYIRDNYSNDKIGLSSQVVARYSSPLGSPSYVPLNLERSLRWSEAHKRHIPDSNYDAVIIHPYIDLNGATKLDALVADSIPASGKELDASFTDQDDKFWRFHVSVAQEYLGLCIQDVREIWKDKIVDSWPPC